jgi:hypothetical protein
MLYLDDFNICKREKSLSYIVHREHWNRFFHIRTFQDSGQVSKACNDDDDDDNNNNDDVDDNRACCSCFMNIGCLLVLSTFISC